MDSHLADQAKPANKPVVFNLGGWPLVINLGLVLYAAYSVIFPSTWFIFFHWPLISLLMACALAVGTLRHVSWSPFYVGPTIMLSETEIFGRGGWGRNEWRLTLNDIERVDWGHFGVVVYKKGSAEWVSPILQVGPFNMSVQTVVHRINAQLIAYRISQAHVSRATNG